MPPRLQLIGFLLLWTATTTVQAAPAPVTYLTRAEAAMLLLQSSNTPVDPQRRAFGRYPDILDGQWYVPYVLTAIDQGLFDAAQITGLLHPHASVTRAEFLKMATRAFGLTTNVPFRFVDIPRDAWYRPYVGIAERYHLFAPYGNPLLLRPERRVTHEDGLAAVSAILQALPPPRKDPDQVFRAFEEQRLAHTSAVNVHEPGQTIQQPVAFAVSPSVVKQAMLRLFRDHGSILDDIRLSLLQQVNAERRAAGLPILRHNAILAAAAQEHARDMYQRGYFSHFTPEGKSYVDRIRQAGYLDLIPENCPCAPLIQTMRPLQNQLDTGPNDVLVKSGDACNCKKRFAMGENIAKGQLSTTQVMRDWMNSEHHRRNILNGAFEEIGIGVFGDVWVQNFGALEGK